MCWRRFDGELALVRSLVEKVVLELITGIKSTAEVKRSLLAHAVGVAVCGGGCARHPYICVCAHIRMSLRVRVLLCVCVHSQGLLTLRVANGVGVHACLCVCVCVCVTPLAGRLCGVCVCVRVCMEPAWVVQAGGTCERAMCGCIVCMLFGGLLCTLCVMICACCVHAHVRARVLVLLPTVLATLRLLLLQLPACAQPGG